MHTPATRLRRALVLASALALVSCTDQPGPQEPGAAPSLAKAPSGSTLAVSTVSPSHGRRGDANVDVTVSGTGFVDGAQATWERGGVPDAKITVHGTRFVSSTQVVATISIAGDADLALYSVAVTNPDRKKGIATESFEVTQAISIGTLGGNTQSRGVNGAGDIVGGSVPSGGGVSAFHWSPATGMRNLGAGEAWDVDESGTIIVGQSGGHAVTWTRGADGSWSAPQPLPRNALAPRSEASAIATLPDGTLLVGGREFETTKGNTSLSRPTLWRRAPGATAWTKTRLALPQGVSGEYGFVNDVNSRGEAVGMSRASTIHPVLWKSDGTAVLFGASGSGAHGINSAGTIIVSTYNDQAAYYALQGDGTWSAPVLLPGGCRYAMAVDDNGNIAGSHCPDYAAVWTPPYADVVQLRGLGGGAGHVEDMSRNGTFIAGSAPVGNIRVGAYWRIFGF